MPREREQLSHDLGVRLPVEPIALDRPRRPDLVQQGAMNRAPAGAVRPQQRAVDVEEDELHRMKDNAGPHAPTPGPLSVPERGNDHGRLLTQPPHRHETVP